MGLTERREALRRLPLYSVFVFAAACWQGVRGASEKPNLIFFLTDDQDQVLGGGFPLTMGSTPMPKTKKLLQDQGTYATNWYIHTPICCPSRSELLTGRYFHNIKQVGGGCMHANITYPNEQSFVRILHEEGGYSTGYFGKYLNGNGWAYPPGYDAWMANSGDPPDGNYIAPGYKVKGLQDLGLQDGRVKFNDDAANYSTSVIGNYSIKWMRKVAKEEGKPFLAIIAPKAPHEPFNPAAWYRDFWDPSWPSHEPRGPPWNSTPELRANHHGNIATQPMLSSAASTVVTGIFKNRWRCLMSVDDLVSDVVKFVEDDLGAGHRTYFMYSSDHGYQLGEFNILLDKRQVYEWDTRIPLLARGPGIAAGSSFTQPGTNVDIAPTLLGLAGISAPPSMDGKSVVPFLLNEDVKQKQAKRSYESEVEQPAPITLLQEDIYQRHPVMPATRRHLVDLGDLAAYRQRWRKEVFLEYYYDARVIMCVEGAGCNNTRGPYPHVDSQCVDLAANRHCWCHSNSEQHGCYPTEDEENNYIALRRITDTEDLLYAEFQRGNLHEADVDFTKVNFIEFYNVTTDRWQIKNLAGPVSGEPTLGTDRLLTSQHHQWQQDSDVDVDDFRKRLRHWFTCSGSTCP